MAEQAPNPPSSATHPRSSAHHPPSSAIRAIRAIRAVERLLAAGVEEADPDAVQQALVAEARALLAPAGALLLTAPGNERRTTLLCGHPAVEPRDISLGVPALRPLRELHEDRRGVLRVIGEPARELARALGTKATPAAAVLVSLRAREIPSRILVLLTDDPDDLHHDDLEVARAFGQAAAASLAQLKLTQEHAARVTQQSALARAAQVLNESLDPNEVLRQICREAAGIIDADTAAVYLGDGNRGLVLEHGHGLPPEMIGFRLAPGQGLAGKVALYERAMLTNDYQRIANLDQPGYFAGIRAALAVPVCWDGQLRGVLSVGIMRERAIAGEDLRMLEAFAELAAVAARNATAHAGLAMAARTDALTGCLNHAALHEALRREIDRSARTGHPLSLILIDLDDFKAVNDEHGHLVGDEVLRRVGHALRQALRPYDLVARYGGDEFAILAVESTEEDAAEIARRALQRAAEAVGDLAVGAHALASAGVVEWSEGRGAGELVYDADRALLYGKRSGEHGLVVLASDVPDEFKPGHFRREVVTPAPPSGPSTAAWSAAAREHTQQLRRRTRALQVAASVATDLAALTDPDEVLETAVDTLRRTFGFYACAILRAAGDDTVEPVAVRSAAPGASGPSAAAPAPADDLVDRCLSSDRAVVFDDVRAELHSAAIPWAPDARARACAPIRVGGERWGVLDAVDARPNAFDEDDVRAMQAIADAIGAALRSALAFERLERGCLELAAALAAPLEGTAAPATTAIAALAGRVARRLGLSPDALRNVRLAAALHDIGKSAVPAELLAKPEPLSDEERDAVQRHAEAGAELLASLEVLDRVRPLVRHSHERWDGRGYPDGLAGEEIPLGARIVFACDAYAAMTSERPYRPPLDSAHAREELRRGAGTQFDPAVVDALLAELEEAATPLAA